MSAATQEKITATAAAINRALDRAEQTGRDAERARVIRIRDACFTGVVLTDDVRAALTRFDGMLLRGEDVPS